MQNLLSAPSPDRIRDIAAGSAFGATYLALSGDKRMLFSASGRAFIMYGVIGRTWIAMGDPVGRQDEHEALIQRFVSACRQLGGRPVFYRVAEDGLSHYSRQGLVTLKLGEEAHVALSDGQGTLQRPDRANLRKCARRAKRDGCSFELVESSEVPSVLPELLAVSSAWLRNKPTREKRFSVGVFDATYLGHFPLAVVRCHGRPVAFASLWLAADKSGLAVDLMRRDPAATYGAMDLLFAHLMAWGAEAGFGALNLGLAPLADFDVDKMPLVCRILARATVSQAGRYYNFEGIRQFKAKFAPHWSPRYLAAPGGVTLPLTILDVARLVAGGYRGLIGK